MKHSDTKQEFSTGAQRDTQEGKLRYDLIPPHALRRMATLYMEGAKHYGDWNWSKGMPFTRFISSMWRHFIQFVMGETDEDHLAQLVFGAFSMMHFQEEGRCELDDRLSESHDVSIPSLMYTAGIVDGEGCIKIARVPAEKVNRKFDRFQLQVQVDMVDPTIPRWLQKEFGGKVYDHKRPPTGNASDSYRWYLTDVAAGVFLTLLCPYLKIKQKNAENAIQFRSLPPRDPKKIKCWELSVELNRRGREKNLESPLTSPKIRPTIPTDDGENRLQFCSACETYRRVSNCDCREG